MELRDFYSFVYKLKNIDVTKGKHEKNVKKRSLKQKISRKSLYFSKNLTKGHKLKKKIS